MDTTGIGMGLRSLYDSGGVLGQRVIGGSNVCIERQRYERGKRCYAMVDELFRLLLESSPTSLSMLPGASTFLAGETDSGLTCVAEKRCSQLLAIDESGATIN